MINIKLDLIEIWDFQDLLIKISNKNKNFSKFILKLDKAMVNTAKAQGYNISQNGYFATDSYQYLYFPCIITLCDKDNNPVNSVDKAEDWFWDYLKGFKHKNRKETILSLSEFSKIMEDYSNTMKPIK